MHSEKRTRNIRIDELKSAYLQRLRHRCFNLLKEELEAHAILPRELEAEIWNYYRRTLPSLQEYYSRYTPEWEVFYENEESTPDGFLRFLKQMRTTFAKRYALAELDVDYYIEQLERLPHADPLHRQLQALFMDKWHRLLTKKEYDYQYHHMEALCGQFILLDKKNGLKTTRDIVGTRVHWLLLNHPRLYRKIIPYEKEMERNRSIRELVRLLGKRSTGRQRHFEAWGGMSMEQWVHHAGNCDIRGITQGNNLNCLLPIEYCYLSDEHLYPLFARRYVEKRLQVFDSLSKESGDATTPHKQKASAQGPFIVCIDTSGSMEGRREIRAKSALLAIARLTEQTHRKCYLINFAEEIRCLLIKDLKSDMPQLAEFLTHRFEGGTDIRPALDEAIHMTMNNGWKKADIILISDFEMPPAPMSLREAVGRLKLRETAFYALVFGSHPETGYLNLCDKYWEMED